jgi:hypothetical protein
MGTEGIEGFNLPAGCVLMIYDEMLAHAATISERRRDGA